MPTDPEWDGLPIRSEDLDVQTAATLFVHGYELVSADANHPLIAAQPALLAPAGPLLRIRVPPTL